MPEYQWCKCRFTGTVGAGYDNQFRPHL